MPRMFRAEKRAIQRENLRSPEHALRVQLRTYQCMYVGKLSEAGKDPPERIKENSDLTGLEIPPVSNS